MNRSIRSFIGFTLGATDGEIGTVKEFYFDDDTWTIRYLIVDTGNWLSGRTVLISPESLLTPDWENKILPTNLTLEQIRHSPEINTDIPVTRQEEIRLYKHYPWISYWVGSYGAGVGAFDMRPIQTVFPNSGTDRLETLNEENAGDKHLRSTANVTGYHIRANDGEIGDVEDFIIDDTTWKIDFMLIDTGNWLPGKKVLISPDYIHNIDWIEATVTIDSTVALIKNSPPYDPDKELTTVYRLALHNHYNSVAGS